MHVSHGLQFWPSPLSPSRTVIACDFLWVHVSQGLKFRPSFLVFPHSNCWRLSQLGGMSKGCNYIHNLFLSSCLKLVVGCSLSTGFTLPGALTFFFVFWTYSRTVLICDCPLGAWLARSAVPTFFFFFPHSNCYWLSLVCMYLYILRSGLLLHWGTSIIPYTNL